MSLTREQVNLVHQHLEAAIRGDSVPSVRDESSSELLTAITALSSAKRPIELQRLGNRALALMVQRLLSHMKAEGTARELFGRLQK